jgi:hypothetical protein
LRYAQNLEYLRIKPEWTDQLFYGRQDEPKTKTTLPRLTRAIIPPSNLWGIDIIAPNLESLSFAIDDDKFRFGLELDPRGLKSLIPTIAESPTTIESLVHLTEIYFECNMADSITQLEEWLHIYQTSKNSSFAVHHAHQSAHVRSNPTCPSTRHTQKSPSRSWTIRNGFQSSSILT